MKQKLKSWTPNLTLGVWLQTLPLFVMFVILWFVAQQTEGLLIGTIKFWEYLIYGWIYASTAYLAGLAICVKYLKSRCLAILYAWFYLFLYAVNISMLHFAGIVLMSFFLRVASGTNWIHYFTGWAWILTGVFVICGLTSTWLICKYTDILKQTRVRGKLTLLILLWAVVQVSKHNLIHPTKIIAEAVGQQQSGIWEPAQTETLRQVANNPLIILKNALFAKWEPLNILPSGDLAAMSDTIRQWHLALGARQYQPLGLKPFNHIVVFATESFSLKFLWPYNTNLPPEISPFYGSPDITRSMFINYECDALPTQPGLAVTYNSHPNVRALLAGNDDLSLVKFLNAQGYETYVLMSCSENFLGNKRFFTKLGFQHVMGLETWEQNTNLLPFIEGWGLMDRALYDEALNILAKNRDKKIFIHVCNTDTHGPKPRDFFGPLEYPPVPESITNLVPNVFGSADDQARAILGGIFRHDHDMGLTIQRMHEDNLLGEDTLVVLTADHNFPPTAALNMIPGYPKGFFQHIPLAFISGQQLPAVNLKSLHSQLDFAPTIMHLLDQPIPPGWWGQSVFATNYDAPYVARFNDTLSVESDGFDKSVSLTKPSGQSASNLVSLFQNLYVESYQTNADGYSLKR
jgi:hypothetical protein